jgi:hypothetical protein
MSLGDEPAAQTQAPGEEGSPRGVIEPARTMSLDDLQKALEATEPHWKKLP